MKNILDLICIGELVIDFIPHGEKNTFIQKAGGAPANVSVMVSRSGHSVGYITKVGNDQFGKFLIKTLEDEKIEILCEPYTNEAITTFAFVHLNTAGERSFTFARKPGADMFLTRDDVNTEALKNCKIFHFGSCSLSKKLQREATTYAVMYAKSYNKLISFDLNYRNLMWDDDLEKAKIEIQKLLPYIDIIKISDEECFIFDEYEDVYDFINKTKISVVVITKGKDGAEAYYNDECIRVTDKDVPVVDTTGAGDAFWGGFIATLIKNNVTRVTDIDSLIIRKALDYGRISGRICVMHKGAIESLPSRNSIELVLQEECL